MSLSQLTGNSARGAALRGLLLGLVLQALLVGAIEIAGQPVQSDVANLFTASPAPSGSVETLARSHP